MSLSDFYYLVASIAIIWFGLIGTVLIIFSLSILVSLRKMLRSAEDGLDRFSQSVSNVIEKFLALTSYAGVVSGAVRSFVNSYHKKANRSTKGGRRSPASDVFSDD